MSFYHRGGRETLGGLTHKNAFTRFIFDFFKENLL